MNVTIIGTGNMAKGIGTRLVAGGHAVTLVGRDPDEAESLASKLRASSVKGTSVSTATLENVVFGDVVILGLGYDVSLEVAKAQGDRLKGKVVVDISNPLNVTYDGLAIPADTSAAEELAKVLPADAKVVKAFNTTFAGTLVNGNVNGTPLDVFIAGDDETAKQTLAQLITDGGMVAVDVGPIKNARLLESLGLLGIMLQAKHNLGYATAWKLVLPN